MSKFILAIAGNMGAGKSTLVAKLAPDLDADPFFESVDDNPHLEGSWTDRARHAFSLQMYFLNYRADLHRRAMASSRSAILDRSIYEGIEVFGPVQVEVGAMTEEQLKRQRAEFAKIEPTLTPPQLVVYLRASVGKLMSNIAARARGYELDGNVDYIERLNRHYERWFGNYPGRKLLVDTDTVNLKDDERAYQDFLKALRTFF